MRYAFEERPKKVVNYECLNKIDENYLFGLILQPYIYYPLLIQNHKSKFLYFSEGAFCHLRHFCFQNEIVKMEVNLVCRILSLFK